MKRKQRFLSLMKPAVIFAACGFSTTIASAQNPVYFATFHDAVTGDNAFTHDGQRYWTVDPGADSYQVDVYERPTIQTYETRGDRYASAEYFEYLDIVQAKVGFDSRFLYAAIDLFGLDKSQSNGQNSREGLVERYGFRFGADPDGRNGWLLVVDQPELANNPNTTFGRLKTFGYRDTDRDVGGRGLFNGGPTGLTVTKSDNELEEAGMNGYDSVIISDGRNAAGSDVLHARIDPTDETIVEFAFDYTAFGLTQQDILDFRYLEFESIKGGPKDPQNYLWNDKYTRSEAGSPNPGAGGLSEFGTQGLGNIYELDTVRGGVIPEPGTLTILGFGAAGLLLRRRKR